MALHQKGNKKSSKRNRQTKHTLVFDESARKDYLTGFRKRKDERRRKFVEKMEREAKEEKKRLKQQVRDMMQARLKHQPIVPEIQHLLDPQVYELPSHTVTVTDVSEIDISGKDGLRLGQNVFQEIEDESVEATSQTDQTSTKQKSPSAEAIAEDPKKLKQLKRKLAKVGQGKVKKLKMNQKKSRKKKKQNSKRGRKK